MAENLQYNTNDQNWQIIKSLFKGFGNNPRNTETFDAMANMNPAMSAYRGGKTLLNMDFSPVKQAYLNEAYGVTDPNVNRQAGQAIGTSLGAFADLTPAMPVAKAGAKAGVKEIARQIETGTGIFGKNTIDPRMNIVPVDVAKQFNMKTTLPQSDEFISAVQGTKGAEITPEGLKILLQRFQKPEQELSESVRTGVFYLPESSPQAKFYKGKGSLGGAYGGTQTISGETLYKNPLLAKGGTGGKAPEEAYKQLVGKEQFKSMQSDLMKTIMARDKGSEAYMFLEKYAPDIADNAWNIVDNSKQGNQLRYALQEAVIANEARNKGFDAILGYSKGRGDKGNFLSEVFDLREQLYPSPTGEYGLMPEFEGLLGKN